MFLLKFENKQIFITIYVHFMGYFAEKMNKK
jgi:hypothetical protein